jgi:hypothetical protein
VVRSLKVVGATLTTIIALGVVATSVAQAESAHHVAVATAPAIITGLQEGPNVFHTEKIEGSTPECQNATFEGTVGEISNKEVTLTSIYSECTFGEHEVNMRSNHCAFLLTGGTDASGNAPLHLECGPNGSEEGQIEIEAPGVCTVAIREQTPKGGVHYTGTKGASGFDEITFEMSVSGITYETTDSAFLCFFIGTHGEGKYTGNITAKAYNEKAGCNPLSGTSKTAPGVHYNECESAQQDLTLKQNGA